MPSDMEKRYINTLHSFKLCGESNGIENDGADRNPPCRPVRRHRSGNTTTQNRPQ